MSMVECDILEAQLQGPMDAISVYAGSSRGYLTGQRHRLYFYSLSGCKNVVEYAGGGRGIIVTQQ